ncbi:histidine kinase [Leucobacter allii]|uniref:histidine kinase n=1 Tax=Leucobacter allii TaxID=2932247 RepID=A0ABY4FMX4_9MICO|nr:histidine kinase [Leucobacter allii]UOQ57634.1 histidine kinase [Leucobacter allii]
MTRQELRAGRARTPDLGARLVEAVLACAVVLVLCVVVLAAGERQASPGAFLAVVGFGALALLGAFAPRTALAVTVPGIFAYYAAGFPPLGMVLPAAAALYLAASRGRIPWAIGGAAVLLVVSTHFRLVDADPAARFTGYEYVTEIALAAAAIALGAAVRLARVRREQAARIAALVAAEQAHLARGRAHDARNRIARELHDTVGHQLTVVALHAAVAEEAVGRDDGALRAALRRVREANGRTLTELRAAVRLLRADDDGPTDAGLDAGPTDAGPTDAGSHDDGPDDAERRDAAARVDALRHPVPSRPASRRRAPQDDAPGAAGSASAVPAAALEQALGLNALLGTAREAGIAADAAIDVAPGLGPIPSETVAAAQRILTEATTNALRHARATRLRIAVRLRPGRFEAELVDDGVGCTTAELGSGHGVAGMRERARQLGGSVRVEATPGLGCAVRLALPLGAERPGARAAGADA